MHFARRAVGLHFEVAAECGEFRTALAGYLVSVGMFVIGVDVAVGEFQLVNGRKLMEPFDALTRRIWRQ
jgi:hypothetical protein